MDIGKVKKIFVEIKERAGKSTLMKLLAGVMAPDTGEVIFHKSMHVQLLCLGIGFEAALSGHDNIILCGMLLGKSREYMESRSANIIEFWELHHFIDEPIYSYSTGMSGRLGFTIALEADPDVLLMDEMLGAGDAAFAEKSRAAILQKLREDRTFVLISHNVEKIRSYCKRAIWLGKGKTVMEGDAMEVSEAYEAFCLEYQAPR
jgi:ABC-type polysaccharide/polyol phosphate transport system ATPase subunit